MLNFNDLLCYGKCALQACVRIMSDENIEIAGFLAPCFVRTEERTGFRSDVKVNRCGLTGLEGNLFEALQFAVRTGAAAMTSRM